MGNTKMVIIFRNDLKVSRGKESAQIAHASMKVFIDRMRIDSSKGIPHVPQDETWFSFKCTEGSAPEIWLKEDFTKIVVECKDLDELLELESKAKEKGLITALIKDNGLTEFKEECPNCEGNGNRKWGCATCNDTGRINKPTITCLAIGPDWSDKVDEITGHLKLR